MGGPYVGKTTFINKLKNKSEYKDYDIFSVGKYVRENISETGKILSAVDLIKILKGFEHESFIIDNPIKNVEQLYEFHKVFDLNNYKIYYCHRNFKTNFQERKREDDKNIEEKIKTYSKEESDILKFLSSFDSNYIQMSNNIKI